jgi:hypothetical protein
MTEPVTDENFYNENAPLLGTSRSRGTIVTVWFFRSFIPCPV